MNVVVINGTPQHGITHYMKELFLDRIRAVDVHVGTREDTGVSIVEFYPDDMPPFCRGCKTCFLRGEQFCPHIGQVDPIWKAMLNADLMVFAYPVYALRAPASIKSLLDHLCVHWTVHRPAPELFSKTAVIITNSIGAPNGSSQKDVRTSLNWMGVSNVHVAGAQMMGDIVLSSLTDKHRVMLERKMSRLADKVLPVHPQEHMSLKVAGIFKLAKMEHAGIAKAELSGKYELPEGAEHSLDVQWYIDHGW